VIAVIVVLASMALAETMEGPPPDAARAGTPTFRVTGSVKGMFPGRVKRIRLRVRNRFDFPIRVREVRAIVLRPGPGCPGRVIRIKPWRGRLKVPPRSARVIRPRVRMRIKIPNACQGATFPIRYSGEAVRA
jgi:hypothetical protein